MIMEQRQFTEQHSPIAVLMERWQTFRTSHGFAKGGQQQNGEVLEQLAAVAGELLANTALRGEELRSIGANLAELALTDSLELGELTTAIINDLVERIDTGHLARVIGDLTAGFVDAKAHSELTPQPLSSQPQIETEQQPHDAQIPAFLWTTDNNLRLTSRTGPSNVALFRTTPEPIIADDMARAMHQRVLDGETARFNILDEGKIYKAAVLPLRTTNDQIIGTIGWAVDLSEQLRQPDDPAANLPWHRALIESIDGIVYESDIEQNRYTFVSQRAEALAGYPLERWLSEDNFWTTTIHPDDLARVNSELGAPHQLEPTYQIEYRLRTADGNWRWVNNFFTVMRGEDQRLIARGVIFDIDQHRQTEEALRRSEARFRAIFDNAGTGIALLDDNGDLALINSALEEMLGYSGDELRGRPLNDLSYHEDGTIGPNFFAEIKQGTRNSFQVEKRYFHKGGHLVWAHVTVTTMRESDNSEFLAICIIKDITVRKAAEERLRQQLNITQAVISSFRGGLCALDREGRVTFANPAAEAALGWREEELLGTNFFDRVHSPNPTHTTSPESWRSSTQQGQMLAQDDALFRRRDGTTFCAGYTLAPILEEGIVIGAVLGFRDLTEQKRLQGELTAVNRLLAESREQAQQHLARELHDGALQVLIGISYQLGRRLAGGEDAELKEVRQSVPEVVAQLRALLGELRPAGLEELGLMPALEGYVARLQREAGPHAPEITLDFDQDSIDLPLPVARCLFRVAQEGLRNAMRHAQPSLVRVHLSLTEEIATLTINDDGHGFSVPSSLAALTQSNHFGLVGMAERVALAGGQLSIRSQIDRGTTVSLQLPLSPEAQPIGRGLVELTSTLILQTAATRVKG